MARAADDVTATQAQPALGRCAEHEPHAGAPLDRPDERLLAFAGRRRPTFDERHVAVRGAEIDVLALARDVGLRELVEQIEARYE